MVSGAVQGVDDGGPPDGAPEVPDVLALAADFPAAGRQDWLEQVDQVLRKAGRLTDDAPVGAGFDKLVRRTPDGIPVPPLLTAQDVTGPSTGVPGAPPYVRGSRAAGPVPAGWDVRQRHARSDPAETAAAVRADLENGVTSIWLVVGDAGTAVVDLPTALDGVLLDLAPVVLDAGPDGAAAEAAAAAFLELAADRGIAEQDLLGTLGLDPIGCRARTGSGPAVESVLPLARRVAERYPLLRAIVVDATPVPAAGGSDAQELGFSLASGVAYLRALTDAGMDVTTAAGLLEFRCTASVEQFPTIAKLRAARRLWSRVLQACGAPAPGRGPLQHAVVSPAVLSRRDPYVNLLRGAVAGFAAGVGGADAVTVAPFDAAIGADTAFSRRISRNTQALLVEESHLARVLDPAGGSWYVEALTDRLAEAGWAYFQELERAGGVLAALAAGLVDRTVGEVRAVRERDAATRRTPITGVSEFPDLAEKPVHRDPAPGAPFADQNVSTGQTGQEPGGLPGYRRAAAFELRRDRSDALLADTGARPRAFLATLGPLAAYTTRAGFARNLLNAGGIEVVEAGPTGSADEVATAFTAAGTPVAVLCGTDELYAERAADTVAALRAAGARHVLLAGSAQPPDLDGNLKAGGDALAVIDAVYAALDSTALDSTALNSTALEGS